MIVLKIFLILLILVAVCHTLFCIYLSIVEREFIKREVMKGWQLNLNLVLFICVLLFYVWSMFFISKL
ncbi:hypothetical protein [Staphylococcus virus vB_SurM-PSU5]|nr:hypothetical protein [Staphylococcus virus vB_SurM-PSU5]